MTSSHRLGIPRPVYVNLWICRRGDHADPSVTYSRDDAAREAAVGYEGAVYAGTVLAFSDGHTQALDLTDLGDELLREDAKDERHERRHMAGLINWLIGRVL